jgi:hypothetical protein
MRISVTKARTMTACKRSISCKLEIKHKITRKKIISKHVWEFECPIKIPTVFWEACSTNGGD